MTRRARWPLAALLGLAAAQLFAAPLRVGVITIDTQPLFNELEAPGPFYRALDRLHVATRPDLLRKFLLFREGDLFSAARLEETERNLRGLDFLKRVSVTASAPHDGLVDVRVETEDVFTTDVAADFAHAGGVSMYDLDVTQKNLLGAGAELTVTAIRDAERSRHELELSTPILFAAYWNADLLVAQASDGEERRLRFGRMAADGEQRWSMAVDLGQSRQLARRYQSGRAVAVFTRDHRALSAQLAYAFARQSASSRRILVGTEWVEDRFGRTALPPGGAPPANRSFRYALLGIDEESRDFVKQSYVNHDARVEDFNLGGVLEARLGLSPRTLDRRDVGLMGRIALRRGWRWTSNGFLRLAGAFEARREDGAFSNQILSLDALAVRRMPTLVLQTFVFHASYIQGAHLDRDVQFVADGTNGLRAYPVWAYAGDARLLVNVEQRVFLGREYAHLVAPGAALFFDMGGAAGRGRELRPKDLHADIGAGLRLEVSRFDGTTVRFDAAYRLDKDLTGARGWTFSFGTTQAF